MAVLLLRRAPTVDLAELRAAHLLCAKRSLARVFVRIARLARHSFVCVSLKHRGHWPSVETYFYSHASSNISK